MSVARNTPFEPTVIAGGRTNGRPPASASDRNAVIAAATRALLEAIGEDTSRPGLEKTPERVARAWEHLTSGYGLEPAEVVNGALFPSESSQLVIVRDIEFSSLCEHHLLPFTGRVHVGYVPGRSILGLSKFARLTDLYARRLQVQERLTGQIAEAVMTLLEPEGVGVVVEAEHMCMVMRGVEKPGSLTRTTVLLGSFRDDRDVREQFLSAVPAPGA
jgi:GTP cyclohydrolase I